MSAASSNTKILHLIDGNGDFADAAQVKQFFSDINGGGSGSGGKKISAQTTRYHTLAVFGGQGTGKSTLLNFMFNTSFATMVEDGGRSQTTRGAFGAIIRDAPAAPASSSAAASSSLLPAAAAEAASATTGVGSSDSSSPTRSKENLLLVLDFEGTDGLERGEDQSFERKLALFAVSCADTVIVNMAFNEVNRFNAANLALLRTVFELNLRLFQAKKQSPAPSARPTLFFVIRDFTSGTLERNQEVLTRSLDAVWDKVAKPAEFAASRLDTFFELRFAALPHYQLQKDRFIMEATLLRHAFLEHAEDFDENNGSNEQSHSSLSNTTSDLALSASTGLIMNAGVRYVFEQRPQCTTGLPLADNVVYLASVWETIKAQRDLDIPAQRLLVARIRAQEAMDEILAAFHKRVRDFSEQLAAGVVPRALPAKLTRLRDESAMQFHDQMTLYVEGSSALVEGSLRELGAKMERASHEVLTQHQQCLARALLRANERVMQEAFDTALNVELPRLAAKYLAAAQAVVRILAGSGSGASNNGTTSADDAEQGMGRRAPSGAAAAAALAEEQQMQRASMQRAASSSALTAVRRQQEMEEQLRRVAVTPFVREFWAFIVAEIDGVVNDTRSRIQAVDVSREMELLQAQSSSSSTSTASGGRNEDAVILLLADGSKSAQSGLSASNNSNSNNGNSVDSGSVIREIALAFQSDSDAVASALDFLAAGLQERVQQRARAMTANILDTLNAQFDRTMATTEDGRPRVFRTKEQLDGVFRKAQSEAFLLLNCLALMRGRWYRSMSNAATSIADSGAVADEMQKREQDDTMRTVITQRCEAFDIRYVLNAAVLGAANNNGSGAASLSLDGNGTASSAFSSSSSVGDESRFSVVSEFAYPSDALAVPSAAPQDVLRAVHTFSEQFVLLDRGTFQRAFDVFQRDSTFKRLFQLRHLETSSGSGIPWQVMALLAFFIVREIISWARDPVWLALGIILLFLFGKEFIAGQYEAFVETGPAQVTGPLRMAVAFVSDKIAAVRGGGGGAAVADQSGSKSSADRR